MLPRGGSIILVGNVLAPKRRLEHICHRASEDVARYDASLCFEARHRLLANKSKNDVDGNTSVEGQTRMQHPTFSSREMAQEGNVLLIL